MERDIFTEEHVAFRDLVRSFIAKEIAPCHEQWERDGMVSRDVWLAAGLLLRGDHHRDRHERAGRDRKSVV